MRGFNLLKRFVVWIVRNIAIIANALQQLVVLLYELVWHLLFLFTDYILVVFEELGCFLLGRCLAQLPIGTSWIAPR